MSNNRETEGLQALGKKTEYRSTYAPEVLEAFENKHPENDSIARNSQASALSPVSLTLPKSVSIICRVRKWWKVRA